MIHKKLLHCKKENKQKQTETNTKLDCWIVRRKTATEANNKKKTQHKSNYRFSHFMLIVQ